MNVLVKVMPQFFNQVCVWTLSRPGVPSLCTGPESITWGVRGEKKKVVCVCVINILYICLCFVYTAPSASHQFHFKKKDLKKEIEQKSRSPLAYGGTWLASPVVRDQQSAKCRFWCVFNCVSVWDYWWPNIFPQKCFGVKSGLFCQSQQVIPVLN